MTQQHTGARVGRREGVLRWIVLVVLCIVLVVPPRLMAALPSGQSSHGAHVLAGHDHPCHNDNVTKPAAKADCCQLACACLPALRLVETGMRCIGPGDRLITASTVVLDDSATGGPFRPPRRIG